MRRSLWFRARIAVLGLWLSTALADPSRFFSCEMNGMTGAGATVSEMAPSMDPSAPPGTAGEHASSVAPEDGGPYPRGRVCSCLQDCSGAPAVVTPTASAYLPAPATDG